MTEKYGFQLVVDSSKRVGGGKGRRHTFTGDFELQSRADLSQLIQNIVIEDTEEQEELGNPFNRLIVDGMEDHSLSHVKTRAVVTFGYTVDRDVMREVETVLGRVLQKPISKMYRLNKGKFEIIDKPKLSVSDFEWVYFEGGRQKGTRGRVLAGAQKIENVKVGSALVFRPKAGRPTEIASWLNHAHVQGGINHHKRKNKNLGFCGQVSLTMRGKTRYRDLYRFKAGYTGTQSSGNKRTPAYIPTGETWNFGRPHITIFVEPSRKRKKFTRKK